MRLRRELRRKLRHKMNVQTTGEELQVTDERAWVFVHSTGGELIFNYWSCSDLKKPAMQSQRLPSVDSPVQLTMGGLSSL